MVCLYLLQKQNFLQQLLCSAYRCWNSWKHDSCFFIVLQDPLVRGSLILLFNQLKSKVRLISVSFMGRLKSLGLGLQCLDKIWSEVFIWLQRSQCVAILKLWFNLCSQQTEHRGKHIFKLIYCVVDGFFVDLFSFLARAALTEHLVLVFELTVLRHEESWRWLKLAHGGRLLYLIHHHAWRSLTSIAHAAVMVLEFGHWVAWV